MADDLLPAFAVDGGRVPGAMLRRLAREATSGATGITLPTDLRVVPRSPTGPGVVIRPGGGVMLNRFQSTPTESYEVAIAQDYDVPVSTTGSAAGRTDYLGIRIDDPEFSGQAPADPLTATYWRAVLVPSIPTTYPFLPLARIVQPASNGAVSAGMITDLREVANPREKTVLRANAATVTDAETLTASGTDGEWFPNAGGEQQIDIPYWATRMIIRAQWVQVLHQPGAANGNCWVEYGPYLRPSTRELSTQRYAWDTAGAGTNFRTTWTVVDDVYIPASYRGTTQSFIMKARNDVSNTSTERPILDANSGTSLEVRFLEVADTSTS